MTIQNITQKTILATNAKEAVSFLDQLLGLHKKSNPRSLIFNTRFGIHTFFLASAIDVIVLDKKNKVVKIKENLQPNTIFFWNPYYALVVELPNGAVKKSKTTLFDTLVFLAV